MSVLAISELREDHVKCRTYIVCTAVAAARARLSVADETIRPYPVYVLYSAAGLLGHDLPQTGVVGGRRAVRDGEVAAGGVA